MSKVLMLFLLMYACITAGEIRIAVSANVAYAMEPLIKAFNQKYPDIHVEVVLGSSGKLTAQIRHGAPYGLFLSANMKFPHALYAQNLAVSKPVIYAQGALAILSKKERDYCKNIDVLKHHDISKIAIANPKTAPYGKAAKEALEHRGLYETLGKKYVYGESISQTLLYATSAADIGIVAKSALYAPHMKKYKQNKHWIEVDNHLYTPIDQGMVILKNAQNKTELEAFYHFMLSQKAKAILTAYGYKTS